MPRKSWASLRVKGVAVLDEQYLLGQSKKKKPSHTMSTLARSCEVDKECRQTLDVVEDLDWDWFDAMEGGVLFGPSSVEVDETGVEQTEGVEAWVGSPQAGERLRHVKQSARN